MAGRTGRSRRPRGRRSAGIGLSAALAFAVLCLAAVLLERSGVPMGPDRPGFSPAAGSTQASRVSGEKGPAGLEVYFLDVGQGDSELIRAASGEGVWTMLIDTGEYGYADGLTEYLRDLGVERIDALVCSHPHTDHMGCMARIVQRFDIGAFYMPVAPDDMTPTTSAYEALLDAVDEQKGLGITALHQCTVVNCPEGLGIEALAPRQDADWDDLNNWSAVLRLTYGDVRFLFTGDAEKGSESDILEDAEKFGWDLKADVLKCGHHGSRTSSSAKFLKAVAPLYAAISCGEGNDYGHPHEETLEKLDKLEVQIYRTDRDGTILAESDGNTITWRTGLPSVKAREWD